MVRYGYRKTIRYTNISEMITAIKIINSDKSSDLLIYVQNNESGDFYDKKHQQTNNFSCTDIMLVIFNDTYGNNVSISGRSWA